MFYKASSDLKIIEVKTCADLISVTQKTDGESIKEYEP